MADLRKAAQMALETLDNMVKVDWHEWDEFASVEDFVRWAKSRASFTAEALRAALAQPESAECDGGQCGIGGYCKQCPKTQPENEFAPDWNAMAVMVEEQQRMAKRIEELTQLVTSQGIRLMDAEAQPKQEPAAWMEIEKYIDEDNLWDSRKILRDYDNGLGEPLYVAPPQREWVYCGCGDEIVAGDGARCGTCVAVKYKEKEWAGLTDAEILADDVLRYHFALNGGAGPISKKGMAVIAAVNAKLKEKNNG